MISINKLIAVLPLPETALNKMDDTENINREPSITCKEGIVAFMSWLSFVNMPNMRCGAIFKMNMNMNVMQKLKMEIFLIIEKTSLCFPSPMSVLTKVLVAELKPIKGIIKII